MTTELATGSRTDLHIRPMSSADLDALVRIDEDSTGRSRPEFYSRRIAGFDDSDRDIGLVVEKDGHIVAFCAARVVEGEYGVRAPVGVADWLGVAPQLRGEGVGRSLIDAMADELRRRGVAEMRTQAGWHEHDLVRFFAGNGFSLAPRVVLERPVDLPFEAGVSDDFPSLLAAEDAGFGPGRPTQADSLAEDTATVRVDVRALREEDLRIVVIIDKMLTGANRERYYRRLLDEALHRSGIRVSLVAELHGTVIGALMARVDYGAYGLTEAVALLDTVVVSPEFAGQQVGRAMLEQLLVNLGSLRVDTVRTEVDWLDLSLLGFFAHDGFAPAQRLSFIRSL